MRLRCTIFILFVLFLSGLHSQNTIKKWYLSVGTFAVDHTSVRGLFDGYFDFNDWSATPFGKVVLARSLNRSFALDLSASAGEIDNKRINLNDEFMTLVGLGLRYKFANGYILKERSWFDPYLRLSGNYHSLDYDGFTFSGFTDTTGDTLNGGNVVDRDHIMIGFGAGINFWFTENFGINLESNYFHSPQVATDYIDFFQHSIGLAFRFGPNDRDKDGILDKDDECPDTPGVPEFNGCPDSDGDGLPDHKDKCPFEFGPKENEGCPWPDRDGDGILDKDDECPDTPGIPQFNGCPDTDNDGLPDHKDDCPTVPGPKENNGCPWPDRDGDTVLDKDDDCPDVPGLVELKGCPQVVLNDILFDFDKYTLRPDAKATIDRLAEMIKKNGGQATIVVGHTDSIGSEKYNYALGMKRAKAVAEALRKQGIKITDANIQSRGETEPKCTNDTPEGRQCNRRVEVFLPVNK